MPRLFLAGLEPADESAARGLIDGRGAPGWALTSDASADAVLIDLDSMSGQMAWMKGLGPGQVSIGLTRALRATTDHRLDAPLDAAALRAVLARIAEAQGSGTAAAAPNAAAMAMTPPPTPSPLPTPTPTPTPEAPSAPVAAPRLSAGPSLAQWIERAHGAFAVQQEGLPRLVVDPVGQRFAPGKSLKALLPYAQAGLEAIAVQPLSGTELEQAMADLGDPQPLSRLVWLLALGRGEGQLSGHAPEQRFQLGKWPQVEREFPKHFRIATVLLKAPGTVAEVAAASGASEAEVADYVNAALAVGHAERR